MPRSATIDRDEYYAYLAETFVEKARGVSDPEVRGVYQDLAREWQKRATAAKDLEGIIPEVRRFQ
jgi:hypothetical protein